MLMKENVQQNNEVIHKDSEHVAPGTQIHYESGLIEQLEKDHVVLLKLLQSVQHAFKQKNSKKTNKKLKKFKKVFLSHLIQENLKLYIYLKHSFEKRSDEHLKVKEFRREMRKISKYIIKFLDKNRDKVKNKKEREEFKKDLKRVYITLKSRLKREEKELFPLYQDKF